jgi:hypothetical protein
LKTKLLGIGLGLECAVLVIDAASVRRRWRRCDSRLLHRNPLENRNEPHVDVPVEAIELHDGSHYVCFEFSLVINWIDDEAKKTIRDFLNVGPTRSKRAVGLRFRKVSRPNIGVLPGEIPTAEPEYAEI